MRTESFFMYIPQTNSLSHPPFPPRKRDALGNKIIKPEYLTLAVSIATTLPRKPDGRTRGWTGIFVG